MSNYLGFMNGREENWDSRSRLQNTSAQKCVNEERQDRSREKKKKKKKHAALIRNAGGVLPVQSQRRKQAERHRRASCVSFLSLFLLSRGIRRQLGRGQLTTSSFVVSHFSLSLSRSRLARSGTRMRRSSLVSLYIARLGRWWSRAKRRTSARAQKRVSSGSQICVKADATFILVFFSSLGLCLYTQKNTYYIGVGEIVRHRGFRQENGLDESVREVRKHDGRVSGGGNHG